MHCDGEITEGYDPPMDGPMDRYYTGTAGVFEGAYQDLPAAVHVSRRPSSGSPTLRVSSIVILDPPVTFF